MALTTPASDQWIAAASVGAVDEMAQLLAIDADLISSEDAHERRAIYHAALGGHAETVRWLLSHGARLDDDEKPLAAAFIGGHAALVDELVDMGAPLDSNYSINGQNFPAWLGRQGPPHMVAVALRHANHLRLERAQLVDCFWQAARQGQVEKLDAFLAAGVVLNPHKTPMMRPICDGGQNQVATLDRVVSMGYRADQGSLRYSVAELLKMPNADWPGLFAFFQGKGFGLASPRACSMDLIHGACAGAGLEAVQFLLDAGVSPNHPDTDGNTPLIWSGNHPTQAVALANMLLDAGADPCRLGEGANSVLHQRLAGDDLDLLDRYMAQGVSLHAANNKGDTPLHVAARQRDGGLVCMRMLMLGADPFVPNKEGVLPGDDNPQGEEVGAALRALCQQLKLQENTPKVSLPTQSRRI